MIVQVLSVVFILFMLYYWTFLIGYIIGSVPFAVLISKTQGIDIFCQGSGNPGATNVKRVLGKKYGILVFLLDFLKGFLPIFFIKNFFQLHPYQVNNVHAILLIGLVLGHSYSLFLKFRGGKGVATTIGGLFILTPSTALLGIVLWYAVFTITRFVSLASLCFALSLPLTTYLFAYKTEIIRLAFSLMIILFLRHIPNILRLWKGIENRFDRK
ncbi:MAG: glycerol-3-phosphate 1-O-acyltransferase PlsY [Puniceicoccales bacterium]|nr:glycerol-3-phosphate 1-O-acyltransferase PlsY [Puniceicoccales bacterium]